MIKILQQMAITLFTHIHTQTEKTENKSRVGHRHHVKQLEYQRKTRDTKKAQSQIPARFCHQ